MADGKNRIGVLDIVAAVVSVLVILGVLTFAGPCVHDDGSAAMCSGAGQGILWVGIIALIASLARMLMPGKALKVVFGAVVAVLGIVVALMPGVIMPLCMMQTMHCQTVMRPVAMVLGIVLAIVAVAGIVMSLRGRKKPSRNDLA